MYGQQQQQQRQYNPVTQSRSQDDLQSRSTSSLSSSLPISQQQPPPSTSQYIPRNPQDNVLRLKREMLKLKLMEQTSSTQQSGAPITNQDIDHMNMAELDDLIAKENLVVPGLPDNAQILDQHGIVQEEDGFKSPGGKSYESVEVVSGFKPFDIQRVVEKHPTNILTIGRSNSGKSVLIGDIAYNMRRKLDTAVVFAGTQDTAKDYEKFVPYTNVYPYYDQSKLEDIVEMGKGFTRDDIKKSIGIFLDDCAYEKSLMKADVMRYLYMNGRHDGFFFVNSVQYIMDNPPYVRNNAFFVFVFWDMSIKIRKKIYDEFFSVFDTFEEFDAIYSALTRNYYCMVIDRTTNNARDPRECVFYYKAKLMQHKVKPEEKHKALPYFLLGNRNAHKLAYKYAYTKQDRQKERKREKERVLALEEQRDKITEMAKSISSQQNAGANYQNWAKSIYKGLEGEQKDTVPTAPGSSVITNTSGKKRGRGGNSGKGRGKKAKKILVQHDGALSL